MIVLDEQLEDVRLSEEITRWYKGAVIDLQQLRPQTLIKDDALPLLLRRVKQPTFVTINYTDFWNVMSAGPQYCIICFKLKTEQRFLVPGLLREILSLPEYSTRRARMGCVISWRNDVVEDYRT